MVFSPRGKKGSAEGATKVLGGRGRVGAGTTTTASVRGGGSSKTGKAKQSKASSEQLRLAPCVGLCLSMAGSIAIVAPREIAMDPRRLLFLPLTIIAL